MRGHKYPQQPKINVFRIIFFHQHLKVVIELEMTQQI